MNEELFVMRPFVMKKPLFTVTADRIIKNFLTESDAVTAYVAAKQMVEIGNVLLEKLRPLAMKKVGTTPVNVQGAQVKMKGLANVYDFHEDAELVRLEEKMAKLKLDIKARQTVLVNMKKNVKTFDKKTGEEITVRKASLVSAGATLEVTFEK
jgi:hypothetical protein